MKVLFDLPDELSDKIHARVKLSTAEVYDLLACIVNGTAVENTEVERYKQAIEDIKAEINTPNRNRCDYFIVDQIEKIVRRVSK